MLSLQVGIKSLDLGSSVSAATTIASHQLPPLSHKDGSRIESLCFFSMAKAKFTHMGPNDLPVQLNDQDQTTVEDRGQMTLILILEIKIHW